MNLPDLTFMNILLAALPILVVLYLMVGRRWGGSKAGPAGWATAVFVSVLFFGAGGKLLLVAWGKAILLAFFVLYVIWMALLLYHTVNEAGVITVIGQEMPGLAHDRAGQGLLLAWIFGSFLQGATGFGVPAAVVAPLLVGLGFAADTAVVTALLGHAWAVTFGSLGSSFLSLMAATGLPGEVLASPAAILLGVCGLGCGAGVLWLSGGKTGFRQRGMFLVIMAAIMAAVQWGLAQLGLWTVAAFGSGLVGLLVAMVWFTRQANSNGRTRFHPRRLLQAFFPYWVLIIVIVLGQLVFKKTLAVWIINPEFPEVVTRFGWQTPAGTGRSINVFGHAGALLLYVSVFTYFWYRWRGTWQAELGQDKPYDYRLILRKTWQGSIKPTVGIYSLVAMALTMQHAGMTQLLAEALSATGMAFPFLSPFIGALGAFMTGSNTNSNVVFGELQRQTAVSLGVSVSLILAAQTAGGAIGSLFAPAKVIVGCSTVSGAKDSQVLKLATAYGLAIVFMTGLLVWLVAWGLTG
ncbi:MAG: L-lactate permease [Chloroflexi bacterium]|nr:MAG: L-lactate permease [Chloroflexota bacterium]